MTIEVSGDAEVEADEGFTVTLSNPTDGGPITTASAAGSIGNDDAPAPSYAIAATDAAKPEGDGGSTGFAFTLTRTGGTSGSSEISYAENLLLCQKKIHLFLVLIIFIHQKKLQHLQSLME